MPDQEIHLEACIQVIVKQIYLAHVVTCSIAACITTHEKQLCCYLLVISHSLVATVIGLIASRSLCCRIWPLWLNLTVLGKTTESDCHPNPNFSPFCVEWKLLVVVRYGSLPQFYEKRPKNIFARLLLLPRKKAVLAEFCTVGQLVYSSNLMGNRGAVLDLLTNSPGSEHRCLQELPLLVTVSWCKWTNSRLLHKSYNLLQHYRSIWLWWKCICFGTIMQHWGFWCQLTECTQL